MARYPQKNEIITRFYEVFSDITWIFKGNSAVDSPVAFHFFGLLRTILFPVSGSFMHEFSTTDISEIFYCVYLKRVQTSTTALQCQFNSNPKVIIRKVFLRILWIRYFSHVSGCCLQYGGSCT